jgi:hypothetical protein
MKRKASWLVTLLLVCTASFSQEETDITNLTKLTFLNPGMSQEVRVAKLQSVYLQAFMNTSAYFSYSSSLGTDGGVYFDPAATAQYRYYYNAKKRVEKGKRTGMNSLNYITGLVETVFTTAAISEGDLNEEKRRPVAKIGAAWGIQRNGTKRFGLDLNLGLGYAFAKGTEYDINGLTKSSAVSQFTLLGQLNLGFWFGKGN